MTKEEFAALLNGREYGSEITKDEERIAKDAGLLVVFGYSDDNVELRGVLNDELGASSGCTLRISRGTRLLPEIEDSDVEVLEKYDVLDGLMAIRQVAHVIEAKWCAEKDGPYWTFETEWAHATFDIKEGSDKFCRGIVIDTTQS